MRKLLNQLARVSAVVVIGLMIFAGTAKATSITGTINFVGTVNLDAALPGATSIDFINTATSPSTLGLHDGTYLPIPNGTPATFTDFTFSPPGASVPIVPLWSLLFAGDTYSFDMAALTQVQQNATQLSVNGSGTLHATGFDDTPGTWSFSTQAATTGGIANLSFSANTSSSVIPEPASMILLGSGLVGLAGIARSRKNRE